MIHWEMFKRDARVNKVLYITQLYLVKEVVRSKTSHPQRLTILLHDNAMPFIAEVVKVALQEIEWKVLQNPPYSPDLAPTDYIFFNPCGSCEFGGTASINILYGSKLIVFSSSRPTYVGWDLNP